jgi:hypothetical protein
MENVVLGLFFFIYLLKLFTKQQLYSELIFLSFLFTFIKMGGCMERSESYYKEQIEDFIDFNYQLKKHGENLMKETKSAELYSEYFSVEGLKEEIESSIFTYKYNQNEENDRDLVKAELINYSFNVKIDNVSTITISKSDYCWIILPLCIPMNGENYLVKRAELIHLSPFLIQKGTS